MMKNNNSVPFLLVLSLIATSIADELMPFRNVKLRDMIENKNLAYDSNHITVSVHSQYCSIIFAIGNSCDFSETNKTIILDHSLSNEYSSAFMETTIHNATNLLISPVCLPWIQVFNAKHVRTVPGKRQDCGFWLRLYNSMASDISIGVRDLSILNSTVDRIYLENQRDILCFNSTIKDLEHLQWKGYFGYFDQCTVNKVSVLKIEDDFIVERSQFGSFERSSVRFKSDEFTFTNNRVSQWSTLGWSLESGSTTMESVTVQNAEPYAIRVSSTAQLILCRNVTFVNAKKPLFSITPQTKLLLYNVTANGEEVSFHSDWITFEPWRGNISTVFISEDLHGCHEKEENTLVCRMKHRKERIILPANQTYDTVVIHDANILEIEPTQLEKLSIYNSSIIFFGNVSSECDRSSSTIVNVVNSTLNTEIPSFFTHVSFDGSYVGKLRAVCMKTLKINRSSIRLLQMEESSAKMKVTASLIESFFNSHILAPMELERVQINAIKNVTLDHPNTVSKLEKSAVIGIKYKGLILKNGNLTLHASIFHAETEAVYLEEGTSLIYDGLEYLFSVKTKFISVENENQVQFSKDSSKRYIFVRNTEDSLETYDDYFHLTSNNTWQYCEEKFLREIPEMVCDFASIRKGVVVNLENSTKNWIFTSASHIVINPFCAFQITVTKITLGGSIKLERMKCMTHLFIESSSLDQVVQHQGLLHIEDSTIDHLDFENEAMMITNSDVTKLEAIVNKTSIAFSNITSLSIQGSFTVDESTVQEIKTIVLSSQESAGFANTTINEIDQYSFLLDPRTLVLFIGVNISNVPSDPIVRGEGRMTMSDVHFRNTSLEGFRQFKRCILICTNVTVSQMNFSCVDLDADLMYLTSPNPIMQTAAPKANQTVLESTMFTNAPSEDVLSDVSRAMGPNQTVVEHNIYLNRTKNVPYSSMDNEQSIGLTAAVLGFFIGIVVSACALILLLGSRPTRASVLKFLKLNQDEGIELLPS